MNLLGKLFVGSLAAWMLGKATQVKYRGTEDEINAIINAMHSSRRFQDELSRPGASVESVIEKLNLKNADAREFEKILGVRWPL